MAIITKSQARGSHWYTRGGQPAHEQPRANGDGTRPTTVADARKLGLLPSVTNILGALAKPSLDTWRQYQAALAAIRTPRQDGESEQYWLRRVVDAAAEQVDEAADLGTRVHAALDGSGPCADDIAAMVMAARNVTAGIVLEFGAPVAPVAERVLVNARCGYAGRCDLYVHAPDRLLVLDYKTRKSEPGKPMSSYDTEAMQLHAYATCIDTAVRATLVNVLISTTEPGRVEVVTHDNDGNALGDAWDGACALWRYINGYDAKVNKPGERPETRSGDAR